MIAPSHNESKKTAHEMYTFTQTQEFFPRTKETIHEIVDDDYSQEEYLFQHMKTNNEKDLFEQETKILEEFAKKCFLTSLLCIVIITTKDQLFRIYLM